MANELLRDRDVDFLLYDVLDVLSLTSLPAFAEHDRETFDLFLTSARRLAREVLFPAYRPMDADPPRLVSGRVIVHDQMKALFPQLAGLGMAVAARPPEVGGQRLPLTVLTLASAYLMAANLGAYGYIGLTAGAAHLLEAFASDELKQRYMEPLYEGRWTGTMALTEPQAGSSLSDVMTKATPTAAGHYLISGAKMFISGGDHDLTDNIVHMVLARIEGAPAGIKGVSLFVVPRRRFQGDSLVDNDVEVSGVIHKIGWRGLPSVALSFGEAGDCFGWLVGEPHRGISYMFQMMNEARIMVGVNGVATASVAYLESLLYAAERRQGRPLTDRRPDSPQVPIVQHADVRRMLLRQKAIVEGGLALAARTALYSDLASHADGELRSRAASLLDLLTPVTKSFPAEFGFQANVLALQIHGGYGYSSEYMPEAWMRDQKLNSIHEGTTSIQGLDLLGRKVVASGGQALFVLRDEIHRSLAAARACGVDASLIAAIEAALVDVGDLTMTLVQRVQGADASNMLLHSADYLELFSILIVGWQWIDLAAAAQKRISQGDQDPFFAGKIAAATYWIRTEVSRIAHLTALCRSGEDSYGNIAVEAL